MANEPKILGFLCNWCCYAAADSAGIARFQYPPNIRVIRVMCTGRIDPVFMLEYLLSFEFAPDFSQHHQDDMLYHCKP